MLEDFRLRVFAKVAECGSFSEAARQLGVTQPAISQNIADLEKYAGTKLLDRSRSGISLTRKGKLFLEEARNILSSYGKLEAKFKAPKSTLIKHVQLEGRRTNILVEGDRFSDVSAREDTQAEYVMEAEGLAILPSFYNTHTHAAMTLLRGYADDMPLQTWLNDYIWPFESRMTASDIRKGSDLAMEEMMTSGTTFFNDMYFDIEETVRSVDESGLRAAIGITVMDNHSKAETEAWKDFVKNWSDPTGGRIQLVMAPHSIYTVSEDKLKKCAAFARSHGMRIHIHLSETVKEVEDCEREHGMTPVRYLDKIGFLGSDVIAAHCVHLDEKEWKLLARRGVTVAHCPCSNMKLGSGRFNYEAALESGCRITLGTDGVSSNNNLDLREEMKFAALLAKVNGDPSLLPATEVFRWATQNGADAFGIDAGVIAAGRRADAILVGLDGCRMRPCYNLVSNLVYSADSSCIRSVLCNGRILLGLRPHNEFDEVA